MCIRDRLSVLLGFEDILNRTVGKLSGGQRRRIDIARALLHNPKIPVSYTHLKHYIHIYKNGLFRIRYEGTACDYPCCGYRRVHRFDFK